MLEAKPLKVLLQLWQINGDKIVKDKLKDLELMIEAFVEEERYEDCALLVKIKNKVIKHYEKPLVKKQL